MRRAKIRTLAVILGSVLGLLGVTFVALYLTAWYKETAHVIEPDTRVRISISPDLPDSATVSGRDLTLERVDLGPALSVYNQTVTLTPGSHVLLLSLEGKEFEIEFEVPKIENRRPYQVWDYNVTVQLSHPPRAASRLSSENPDLDFTDLDIRVLEKNQQYRKPNINE